MRSHVRDDLVDARSVRQAQSLWRDTQLRAEARLGRRAAEQRDLAVAGATQPLDDAEKRCLACTVAPYETDGLAGANAQRDIVQNRGGSVCLRN